MPTYDYTAQHRSHMDLYNVPTPRYCHASCCVKCIITFRLDPISRTPYGPAAKSAASRGRTYDSTRPECHRPQFDAKLASHGASTPSESALAMGTPPVPHFAGRLAVVCRSPKRRCRSGRRGRGWERPGVSMPRTGIVPSTDGGACSLRELRAHLKYRSRLVERRVRVRHDFAVRRGGAVGLEHARET